MNSPKENEHLKAFLSELKTMVDSRVIELMFNEKLTSGESWLLFELKKRIGIMYDMYPNDVNDFHGLNDTLDDMRHSKKLEKSWNDEHDDALKGLTKVGTVDDILNVGMEMGTACDKPTSRFWLNTEYPENVYRAMYHVANDIEFNQLFCKEFIDTYINNSISHETTWNDFIINYYKNSRYTYCDEYTRMIILRFKYNMNLDTIARIMNASNTFVIMGIDRGLKAIYELTNYKRKLMLNGGIKHE